MHPYEIHITVDNAPDGETFREICKVDGVKAVMLNLQTQPSTLIRDVMTSSTVSHDDAWTSRVWGLG